MVEPEFTSEQVRGIAMQVAGATAGVFMQMHPQDVMPSETIIKVVDALLAPYGIGGEDNS